MAMARRRVGEILKAKGKVNDQQIQEALNSQKSTAKTIGQTMVDLGMVSTEDVLEALAEQMGVQHIDLSQVQVDESAAGLVPEEMMERYKLVPIRIDGNQLTVAMANPKDLMAIDDLRTITRLQIRAVLAAPEHIDQAMEGVGGATSSAPGGGVGEVGDIIRQFEQASTPGAGGRPTEQAGDMSAGEAGQMEDLGGDMAQEAPVIRLMQILFREAIRNDASDIHIEPGRKDLRVRMRIDGVLHELMRLPNLFKAPLTSRVKILGDMDIAERRAPQDGRIRLQMSNKNYDVRVSTIPTTNGEKAVMRLLDQSSVMVGLERLGFMAEDMARVQYLMEQPYGMMLSTGPTGSGKTTTQYSIMSQLNKDEVNIITIEDPVEYSLPGLSQVHVNRRAGVTFSSALRSFLRQDPDIIMVGEIRDLETADIAIQAALTGHLVLSTLHTNDAPTAITRLIDMGVEPFLISASLVGVMAQRLGRKICENCKEPFEPAPETLARFAHMANGDANGVTYYHGKGCDTCRHSGYKGRIGLFELMTFNSDIAELTMRRAPLQEVREAAVANGMKSLLDDGWEKIQKGLTTPDEVLRVVATAGT